MSELIKGPRRLSRYPDRWLDCQHALEPLFRRLISAQSTPYIDLAAIFDPISIAAVEAGWHVDDIGPAIEELAINYQLGVQANRQTDVAIAAAIARTQRPKPLN